MSFARRFGVFLLVLCGGFSVAQSEIVVKPGDTLWAIASRYGTTVADILEFNGLTGTDLFPGAILKLPTGATSLPETYTVRAGDTLYDIAVAFDLSLQELIAINAFDGATIQPGQVLRVRPAPDALPPEPLVVVVQPGDTLWGIARSQGVELAALRSANDLLSAALEPGDELVIPGRFAASPGDQGGTVPPTIEVGVGDTLWDIAQRYNTSVAALMAANDLASQNLRVGQVLKVVPDSDLGRATPITAAASSAPATTMVWPLVGVITSRYGYRQLNISGSNFHTGLDIDGDTGDPILAASAGIVSYSGWRGGYGNLVIVEAGGREYFYAHASQLLVSVGAVVAAGDALALVGSTGASTGSHLHFEIRVDGTPVDPLPLLEQHAGQP